MLYKRLPERQLVRYIGRLFWCTGAAVAGVRTILVFATRSRARLCVVIITEEVIIIIDLP